MIRIKKTALNTIHHILGGKMVDYAGYEMPMQFKGANHEFEATKKGVGVFDASHMGDIWIHGKGSLDLIQKITSNDPAKLTAGKLHYSHMLTTKGEILDEILVYMISDNNYLLVVNALKIHEDMDWILAHNTFNSEIINLSDCITLIVVEGPKALQTLQKLTDINLKNIYYNTFFIGELAQINNVLISAAGYTGAEGLNFM